MPSKTLRRKAQATLIFQTIQDSPSLQDILAIATSLKQKIFFIAKLKIALPDPFPGRTESPEQLFDILTTWFGKYNDQSSRFDAVATAFKHRRLCLINHCNKKVDFIHRIGLNWSPAERDFFLEGVDIVHLPKLGTPYPAIKQ
jgi:hypothetical protein